MESELEASGLPSDSLSQNNNYNTNKQKQSQKN
jgi:hypothetical protein